MFKTEIDVELRDAQLDKQRQFKEGVEETYNELINEEALNIERLDTKEEEYASELKEELAFFKTLEYQYRMHWLPHKTLR